MAVTAKKNEIDVVHALQDCLDLVIKHLDVESLLNMSQVCTDWQYEALRERAKLMYIKFLKFHHSLTNNLGDKLRVDPELSLFFHEPLTNLSDPIDLPNSSIAICAPKCFTTEDEEFGVHTVMKYGSDSDKLKHDFAGLFFPKKDGVQVTMKFVPDGITFNWVDFGYQFELDDQPRSTFVMFVKFPSFCGKDLARKTLKRYKDKHDFLLVGTDDIIVSHDDYIINCCVAGVMINGPSVESRTTTLNCSSLVPEIESKLLKMKANFKLRNHNTGLLYGFFCDGNCDHTNKPAMDSEKMLEILKRIFPGIPFVGMYQKRSYCMIDGQNDGQITDVSIMHRDTTVMIIASD